MEERKPGHYLPARDIDWTAGAGQPAGVFWLDGRCVMAAHGTAAEAHLLEAGAIAVATLRFDRDFLEGRRPGARIERVGIPLRRAGWRRAAS